MSKSRCGWCSSLTRQLNLNFGELQLGKWTLGWEKWSGQKFESVSAENTALIITYWARGLGLSNVSQTHQQLWWHSNLHWRPPLHKSPTSLQRPLVLADSPYIDSCLNHPTTATSLLFPRWPLWRGSTLLKADRPDESDQFIKPPSDPSVSSALHTLQENFLGKDWLD